MKKVILLDVDGVLVTPGGYRAALRATMHLFFNLMGLTSFDIPEENLTVLENRGITSEWDMIPLLLASMWSDILRESSVQNLPPDLSSAAVEIGKYLHGDKPLNINIPMFELVAGQYPSETALQQNRFSSIPMELRTNILHKTRDIHFSQTMRFFQHFTLGSLKFTQTYNLPAELETESFLLTYDTPNINGEIRARLLRPGIYPVAFTSRPSGPPREVAESIVGYAPEAELALELVGLPDIPLIAFGKLEYLASKCGLDPVALVKPSPIHALAAIAAAFTREELSAIRVAADWQQTGQLNSLVSSLPRSFELIVVEDTMSGIRSTLKAGEILQRAGLDVYTRAFGFTSGNSMKAIAFQQAGIPCFEDWESLLNKIEIDGKDG
jgi:hypothetical protein